MAPISVAMAKTIIESGKGPPLKSVEGIKLEEKKGFGYRFLLGELIFTYYQNNTEDAFFTNTTLRAWVGLTPLE